MKLVIGLGNPGIRYKNTRHNVGFDVVDCLAQRKSVLFKKLIFFPGKIAKFKIKNDFVILLKSTTFMNNSGKAVLKAMHRWRLRISDIIVVVDDVNVDLGYLKIREKGSSGSHNGLKSIIDWLNSDGFTRFRIGIGPKPPDHDMIDFVLGCFDEDESLRIEKVVEKVADAVEHLVTLDPEKTMNLYNGKALIDC